MSGMLAPPPDAGAMPADDPASAAPDADDTVVVTICKNGDGTYMVYAGDEPDADAGDMSGDDVDAMGPAGGAPAPTAPVAKGQPADSIGAALKMAMDIMNEDKSSEGAPGDADSQFADGFSASKAPTPVGMGGQKY